MSLCNFFKVCDDWKKINEGSLPDSDSIEHSHDLLCNLGTKYHCDLREKCITANLFTGLPQPVGQA